MLTNINDEASSDDNHLNSIIKILSEVEKVGLRTKYELFGFAIDQNGKSIVTERVKAIEKYGQPTTNSQLRRFIAAIIIEEIFKILQKIFPAKIDHNFKLRKNFIRIAHEFTIIDDKLYKLGKFGQYFRNLVVDADEIKHIFNLVHNDRGHSKINYMYQYINQYYLIPILYSLIKEHIKKCHECQTHDAHGIEKDQLYIHLPLGLFHTIVIDTIDTYILSARDHFSGWIEARISNTNSALDVATLLYEEIITRYGIFNTLFSEHGSEFCNQVINHLTKFYIIHHKIALLIIQHQTVR
ncbi:uncharacterized protein KGF55_005471 [Candida pseudojiufengensis]|uniref:uncharacterized protein n=1 Tax=Candida pseudojiufengensis TaxID=497109 RepID=UPI00222420B1|nr:uncharacterized protein KGF55_005471 [Candida pseudojiufengensis]KAI5959321.1 hypothetical protein KGF55_005471 [Candida pseudojiufengensis]